MTDFLLFIVVGLALVFTFANGFHDAAKSVSTVIGTRVLTPLQAVVWAAFWNFVAFALMGTFVAKFIATDILYSGPEGKPFVSIGVIFAALLGAVFWNVLTARLDIPSSSSHALIGGMIGAGIAKGGGHVVNLDGLRKVGTFIIYSPLIGLALGLLIYILLMWLFHKNSNVRKTNNIFRRLHLVSAAAFSVGHGTNDAQKTMGLIFLLLVGSGKVANTDSSIPLWVVVSAHAALSLGTLFGGWRIVKTAGAQITRLQPMSGFAAETAAAATIFFASINGIPVSTTHTITGGVVGVGSGQRLSAVRWGLARREVWAWIFTIPGAAAIAALSYGLVAAVS